MNVGGNRVPFDSDQTGLTKRIGFELSPAILNRSLTHRSFAYENGGLPTNERLEFLGDSVLGIVVTDTLYRDHPELPEGQLAKMRSAIVNAKSLAEVARGIGLGTYIRLGRGEEQTGGRDKSSILADTLEALIGAVYLDRGLADATELVHALFDLVIARAGDLGAGLDWKTSLQELAASASLGPPEYVIDQSGPDHNKVFNAQVRVGGRLFGNGSGPSKKAAEQLAAESAWAEIKAALIDPGQDRNSAGSSGKSGSSRSAGSPWEPGAGTP